MTSFTGSLTNFNGEPREEGPVPVRFITRGEPEELLGDSGGVPLLPAGNMEGNELFAVAFVLLEFPGTFSGKPAFASLSKDFTCIQMATTKILPSYCFQ